MTSQPNGVSWELGTKKTKLYYCFIAAIECSWSKCPFHNPSAYSLANLLPRAFKVAGIYSAAVEIKCCKETKITAPPNA